MYTKLELKCMSMSGQMFSLVCEAGWKKVKPCCKEHSTENPYFLRSSFVLIQIEMRLSHTFPPLNTYY